MVNFCRNCGIFKAGSDVFSYDPAWKYAYILTDLNIYMLINGMLIKECRSSFLGEQYDGWRKKQTKNWCDVLIVVTKYNKFRIKASTIWFFKTAI